MKNNNFAYCSLETVGLKEQYHKNNDLILQINFIISEASNDKDFIYSDIIKNKNSISLEAMASHSITEKIKQNSGKELKRAKSYKELFKYSKEKRTNCYFVVFDSGFSLDLLERIDIKFEHVSIIDLKQIYTYFLFGNNSLIEEEIDFRMNIKTLMYYFDIEEEIDKYIKNNKIKSIEKNNNIEKTIILKYLLDIALSKKSLEDLLKISSSPIVLKYVYFKNKKRIFKDLNDNELFYLSQNHYDKNVIFSSKYYLEKRGVKLDKHLITAGKYAGYYVENIEDIEYLEWFEENMRHFGEEVLIAVKNRILELKNIKTSDQTKMSISIVDTNDKIILIGELPSNIREWLKTQPFIDVKYNKCDLLINSKNEKRQRTILEKIISCVKVVNYKKEDSEAENN